MKGIPESLNNLITAFSTLPGIGKKTAERLAIFILKSSDSNVNKFSNAIIDVKKNISTDKISCCFKEDNLTVNDFPERDGEILCVIKEPTEVFLIEKSGYNGHYHVLNGLISPLDGVSHEDLNIAALLKIAPHYNEIIIAIDPTSEGDVTTQYLIDVLNDFDVKISRLARGIPVGLSFDYIDEVTLTHSLEDRVEVK